MLAIVSCKKDSFLNRVPLSDISQQNFFTTETDLQLYCNQYYSQLDVQNFVDMDDNSDDKANLSINRLLAGTLTVASMAAYRSIKREFVQKSTQGY